MNATTTVPAAVNHTRRLEIIDELCRRYGVGGRSRGLANRLRFWRKKYSWIAVVGGTRLLKRAIDAVFAAFCLIALSPVFLAVGLAIKFTDGGPALFWQTRVGQWGREFPFPKFRSMVMNAEELKAKLIEQSHHTSAKTFKMKKDPRITWIGRIIRKLSIDEMPQLWCVLRGDMSLVGPRPPVVREVQQYTLADRRRLDVVPGLTCIWQVSGRGDIPFEKQLELDIDYIRSRSLWIDCKILLATIPAVLFGKGAY